MNIFSIPLKFHHFNFTVKNSLNWVFSFYFHLNSNFIDFLKNYLKNRHQLNCVFFPLKCPYCIVKYRIKFSMGVLFFHQICILGHLFSLWGLKSVILRFFTIKANIQLFRIINHFFVTFIYLLHILLLYHVQLILHPLHINGYLY